MKKELYLTACCINLVAGILIFISSIFAGSHAFFGGSYGLVWILLASFLLISTGFYGIYDFYFFPSKDNDLCKDINPDGTTDAE